ncbi:hypothetical protein, partial [Marinilabilia sp.]|uniref:hypothetical protein n=1 Tax=Marinilabilia sp. TaxID=2021252 RepID=UPI0025BEB691
PQPQSGWFYNKYFHPFTLLTLQPSAPSTLQVTPYSTHHAPRSMLSAPCPMPCAFLFFIQEQLILL